MPDITLLLYFVKTISIWNYNDIGFDGVEGCLILSWHPHSHVTDQHVYTF